MVADNTPNSTSPVFITNTTTEVSASTDGVATRETDWGRRRDIPLTILAWVAVIAIVFWAAGHIAHALLIITIAALLAYALLPAVNVLDRFLPRWLSIIIVYLAVLSVLSGIIYLVVTTALTQVAGLSKQIAGLLSGNSPIYATLHQFGISNAQITQAQNYATSKAAGFAGSAFSLVTGLFNVVLDTVLVAVLSIYAVVDGSRVARWLRNGLPVTQRTRAQFFLDTIERVVGGYIRGELLLCSLVGVLVGGGMFILHVPFAVLLGVLAFFFEFIPFLGPFISALFCVAVAFPNGIFTVALVLLYFVGVHLIEGYLVGPRIVGKSVGLHPAIALFALVAAGDLFGLVGALFAAPIAGLIQALVVSFWLEWRRAHPEQFPMGHTVSQDVAIVPVVTPTKDVDAAPSVEPQAAQAALTREDLVASGHTPTPPPAPKPSEPRDLFGRRNTSPPKSS